MSKPVRILVVDDDPDFLDFARTVLEKSGYEVVVAPGEQALAEIEAEKPDLLVLDVMMAQWDSGFQLMWKLKTDDRYNDVPILIVTAVDNEVHQDFARHAYSPRTADDQEYLPVDGYIVKPTTALELVNTAKWVLGRVAKGAARE